jgi:aspartyl/asparaginyl beta-hydroxylase (cupin superfamily)
MPAFWWDARNRAVPSWTDHPDINAVMLAASLVPEEPNHVPI